MNYDLNQLAIHMEWALSKPTAPGWSDIRRSIRAHTLYFIHEGRGSFTTDREYAVEGGTIAYMKPGLQMTMRSDERFPLQMTMLLFDCAQYAYADGWQSLTPIRELRLPFLRKLEGEQAKRFGAQFRRIRHAWFPGPGGRAVQSKSRLLELLQEMHAFGSPGPSQPMTAELAIERIQAHIESSYDIEVHIEQLAERHGISSSYLRKRFQQKLGMSPKQYHSRIRNEHARKYLMYTELSMKDIAAVCGYLEEFHFSKNFKQMNGMPPTRFREHFRALSQGSVENAAFRAYNEAQADAAAEFNVKERKAP